MPFNFYDTHTLLMAVQQLTPAATFLRDRYFPTNDASDIFATDDVLVEFRDGSKKLAPFVAPRKGGVTVLRAGYNMERYTPPFVAPRRVLTLDELRKRGFGEALYSQLTPEQRQQTLILRDADELGELITNREEAMAAETMLTNGCVMKHIADDVDKADEMEIRFYSEASNPATYTPTAKWDATGGKILKDLEAMIRMLTKRGLRASDLVCSPDVADTIINDAAVQKLLDNRRIEIGNVEPELLPDGAAIVARLNVLGRIISVISYDLTYTDDVDKADEMEIRFYSEASNPATYTPTAKWDATGGKILKDLEAMIRMLTKRGLRASDLVCSPDVADTIINDAAVQKLLDNRRIEIGNVEPELLPDGAAIVARLNVLGRIISVISYDLTYTDDEGNDKLYIPSGKCVLTAPGAGRTAYGAVSQVEQSDGEFHTYAGRRVPKYVSSAEGNSRTLTISSRPLMIPNNKNPFIVADVLTD